MKNKFASPAITREKIQLIPTIEQETIIAKAIEGKNIAIKAFAGSAKTSTCVMVAEQLVKNSLYIAFNKSIAEEAIIRFPSYVQCSTLHSLAYRAMITPLLKKKLNSFFDFNDIPFIKGFDKDENFQIKIATIDTIKAFCQSDSRDIKDFAKSKEKFMVDLIYNYWKDLTNEHHKAKITHDVYLKMFHLSNPRLAFDIIYLDEAQDSNPVTLDIVLQQKHAQIILVGDSYQAIYEWRGAVDALDNLSENFEKLYLTESFRFTQEIADMAFKITSYLGNVRKIAGKAINKTDTRNKAIIVRNNSTLIEQLLLAYENKQKVYVLSDLKDLWAKLYHISNLWGNKLIKYPHKELAAYKTFKELEDFAKAVPELQKLINLTKQLSSGGLYNNIENIKSIIVDKENLANFTLTTAHKSKGLEWEEVTLTSDLLEIIYDDVPIEEILKDNQTGNLLYVAITRAKYKLNLPDVIYNLLENIDEY
jgi:hypothetical protein